MTWFGRGDSARNERGFTLIELLVVIVITAILAGIAIPVFLHQRSKGFRADVMSSLKSANVAAQSYAVGQGGSYEGLDGDDGTILASAGFRPKDTVLIAVSAEVSAICVLAVHLRLPDGDDWRVATLDTSLGAPTDSNTCVSVTTPAIPGPDPDPTPTDEPTDDPDPTPTPTPTPSDPPLLELPVCDPPLLVEPLCQVL